MRRTRRRCVPCTWLGPRRLRCSMPLALEAHDTWQTTAPAGLRMARFDVWVTSSPARTPTDFWQDRRTRTLPRVSTDLSRGRTVCIRTTAGAQNAAPGTGFLAAGTPSGGGGGLGEAGGAGGAGGAVGGKLGGELPRFFFF